MPFLNDQLPDCPAHHPADKWIHSTPVQGPFGITAAVKDFEEVIDWQQHTRELTQGYYRLIHPPRVRALKQRLEAAYHGFTAVLFTSAALAEKETRDLLLIQNSALPIQTHDGLPSRPAADHLHILQLSENGLQAGACLLADPDLAAELFERNRRRGGSLSARAVAHLMGEPDAEPYNAEDLVYCLNSLRELEKADHATLYPSGMAAVTAVLDLALTTATPRMLVLGNVYRDTHMLLEEHSWAGREVHTDFLDTHDLDGLRERIGDPNVAGVFIETITNPLIEIPDVPTIATICRNSGKKLFVDSTMAAPLNIAPLELGADVVIHSTSKYLSGHNAHGGGVVLTRDPDWAACLQDYQQHLGLQLSPAEATALRQGLETYPERLARFNANGEALAETLRAHPAVKKVYFANAGRPEWLKGLGSVVSCELADSSLEALAAFFDAPLPGVIKAPSLGSDQTLFCPYVLLAYYDKDDAYLADCNLSKTLLRFAGGCESPEEAKAIRTGIIEALDALTP